MNGLAVRKDRSFTSYAGITHIRCGQNINLLFLSRKTFSSRVVLCTIVIILLFSWVFNSFSDFPLLNCMET